MFLNVYKKKLVCKERCYIPPIQRNSLLRYRTACYINEKCMASFRLYTIQKLINKLALIISDDLDSRQEVEIKTKLKQHQNQN